MAVTVERDRLSACATCSVVSASGSRSERRLADEQFGLHHGQGGAGGAELAFQAVEALGDGADDFRWCGRDRGQSGRRASAAPPALAVPVVSQCQCMLLTDLRARFSAGLPTL